MSSVANIRCAETADYLECEGLVRDAFWDVYRPGCVEHLVLHEARASADYLADLDLVAAEDGHLVGCMLALPARIVGATSEASLDVLSLGPLAVRPECQRRGIGTHLTFAVLEQAAALGWPAAFLYGSPAYYSRFGFEDARRWGVTTAEGHNLDVFMGIELAPSGLDGVSGRLVQSEVFSVDASAADAFDGRFPPREKHVTDTQLADLPG